MINFERRHSDFNFMSIINQTIFVSLRYVLDNLGTAVLDGPRRLRGDTGVPCGSRCDEAQGSYSLRDE